MMPLQPILVGIAAGIAAALMFLAPVGGTALAFPLFILTGLPIGLAGLGWGLVAGAVAAAAGTLIIAATISLTGAASFLLLFALPVIWVARQALRSRPLGGAVDARREWYPLGRLLTHLSGAVAIGVVIVGILIGFDRQAMAGDVTKALVDLFGSMSSPGAPAPTAAELAPFVQFYLAIMPFSVTAVLVIMLTFDLWLAALVARMSGRLDRPQEKLWGVELPVQAMIALGVFTLLAFLPGAAGEVARVFAGALAGAAALTGLAVMHALTVGMSGRTVLLVLVYAVIVFSGLPLLLFVLLAVAEALFRLRARRFKGTPP